LKLLGLFIHTGQSSAALLDGGEIIAAVAQERFNRVKQSRAFPFDAIKYCLAEAGLEKLEDLDGIAVSWNPSENMRNINMSGFTQWRRYDPEWLYIVPNQLMSFDGKESFKGKVMTLSLGENSECPIYYVDHHMCHLAHAICQSQFEEGLAIVADEYGEFNSVTIATFDKNGLEVIKEIPYPNSLGVFYAAMTEYLGFTPNSEEWKLMGAAAYGNPERFSQSLEKLLDWDSDAGEWILDSRYIEHANLKRAGYLNDKLLGLIGIPVRDRKSELEQEHFDLAAAAQNVFEKRIFQLVNFYAAKTGGKNLAAAGGCFMNSLCNGKIIENTPVEKLFIPYAAADNGGAMGAPLYIYNYFLKNRKEIPASLSTPYLGPEYSDLEIENTLNKFKINYSKLDDVAGFTAQQIADGKLIGWFQGRMEFGERALGNRSILADPRFGDMKDKINSAVKYREAFRPFAPSILEEKVLDFFDIPAGVSVPYMEQVYRIKMGKRGEVPAVVHADGTGRLQTVSKKLNPLYYSMIQEFEKLTGIPVVLNTSFNVQGEPIVCFPEDAIRCFYSCGLDILIIGHFCLRK
jgi:carbamoyltransferase